MTSLGVMYTAVLDIVTTVSAFLTLSMPLLRQALINPVGDANDVAVADAISDAAADSIADAFADDVDDASAHAAAADAQQPSSSSRATALGSNGREAGMKEGGMSHLACRILHVASAHRKKPC
jgi:hypothetical protein